MSRASHANPDSFRLSRRSLLIGTALAGIGVAAGSATLAGRDGTGGNRVAPAVSSAAPVFCQSDPPRSPLAAVSIDEMVRASDVITLADVLAINRRKGSNMAEILYQERAGGRVFGPAVGQFGFEKAVIDRCIPDGTEPLLSADAEVPVIETGGDSAMLLFMSRNDDGKLAVLSQYLLIADGFGFVSGTPIEINEMSVLQIQEAVEQSVAARDQVTQSAPKTSLGMAPSLF